MLRGNSLNRNILLSFFFQYCLHQYVNTRIVIPSQFFFFNFGNLTLLCAFQKYFLSFLESVVSSLIVSVVFFYLFNTNLNPHVVLVFSCPLLAGGR